jgi:ribosomal protein L16 Arg81 hydroxylase
MTPCAAEAFDLSRMIDPCPLETFFSEHWDRRPLLVKRSDRGYFRSLFSVDDVDDFLSNYGGPNEFSLRLVKKGATPPAISLPTGVAPSLSEIHAAYREGYTLNINEMATHHPAIRRMTHAVLGDLGARPRANLYLTPPGSRAFDLHFDTHDVFILQLGGAKEWRVFEAIEESPTATHSDGSSVPRGAVGAPLIDIVLEAGDLLYIPRGFVHEAYTDTRHSIHITLGVRMGTYLDLLDHVVRAAGQARVKLRASIPPRSLLGRSPSPSSQPSRPSRAEIARQMLALVASQLDEAVIGEAIDAWAADELVRMAPVESPRFTSLLDTPPELGLHDPLEKPSGTVTSLSVEKGRARLHFQRGCVEGPWKIKPALAYVAATAIVRAADFPGTLDDAEKLVLAKRMMREGLLRRREPAR